LIAIKIRLSQNGIDRAQALSELFGRKPGTAEVRLRLERPRDFSIILDVTTRVRPDKEFRAEVERICGPESMEILAE
jgi:DNA polymerase-3 subunit alpha